MQNKRKQTGLTLIEAAAVLSITAIAATLAAPGLQGVMNQRRLDAAAGELAASLQLARTEAIARNQPVRLTANAAQRCYVVHTGAANQCSCSDDGIASCAAGAQFIRSAGWRASDRVALQTTAASILFDPLHGTASPTATLRVIGADGRAIHHIVNVMGRVRSCSPLATVPGLRAC